MDNNFFESLIEKINELSESGLFFDNRKYRDVLKPLAQPSVIEKLVNSIKANRDVFSKIVSESYLHQNVVQDHTLRHKKYENSQE